MTGSDLIIPKANNGLFLSPATDDDDTISLKCHCNPQTTRIRVICVDGRQHRSKQRSPFVAVTHRSLSCIKYTISLSLPAVSTLTQSLQSTSRAIRVDRVFSGFWSHASPCSVQAVNLRRSPTRRSLAILDAFDRNLPAVSRWRPLTPATDPRHLSLIHI